MARVILLAALVGLPVLLEAQLPGGGGGDGSPLVELQKGIGLLRQGKTAEARELFSTLADRDSLSPLPCYYLALAEIELGASAAAVTALERAVARGWEHPEKLLEDRGLAPSFEKDPTFREGVAALVGRVRDRIERGIMTGQDLSSLTWVDGTGTEHAVSEFAGRPLMILFVRADEPQDLTALYALAFEGESETSEGEEAGQESVPLVWVHCEGKSEEERLGRLERYRSNAGVTIPLGLGTDEQRRALGPWRAWPSLVRLDGEGRARQIVEGFPPDLEERYAALRAGRIAPAPKDSEPEETEPERTEP